MTTATRNRTYHDFSLRGFDAKIRLECRPFCSVSLQEWFEWMNEEERSSATNYRTDDQRDLFVARRGILRELLSEQLEDDPASLQFARTELHQLQFRDNLRPCDQSISFSVAKSQDWIGAAVARDRLIGIDLEQIQPLPELTQMAQNHLHDDELSHWLLLGEEDRLTNYYLRWTAKEATLKALGLGLSVSTKHVFALDSRDSQPSKIYWSAENASETYEIGQLWRIHLPKQHVGSIVLLHPKAGLHVRSSLESSRGTSSSIGE